MTTTKKTCFKCGQSKSRNEFYRHSGMEDGLLGKCIDCTKADVAINRAKNLSRIQEYDRRRGSRPDRRKRNAERASKYLADRTRAKAAKAYYEKHPEKRAAVTALGNAVRDGRVEKYPCLVCGEEKVQGHHFDYGKPLDVVWLCVHHHSAFHKIEREIQRMNEKQEKVA